jgi:hypothetical protein
MTLVHRSQSSAKLQDDSESCSSLTLLPLRSLHNSNSVNSCSSITGNGNPRTNRTPTLVRRRRQFSFSTLAQTPTQKQKLCFIFCFMLFLHRRDVYEFLSPVAGKLIRLITLYLIHHTPQTQENALWKASVLLQDETHVDISDYTIDLVVSHCNIPIDWIFTSFASDPATFRNITIITKCNQPVVGAPATANIVKLPNVGRCDHTYAHYLTNYVYHDDDKQGEDNHVVLFLKDNDNQRRAVYSHSRSLEEMLQITKQYGFACHEERIWTVSKLSPENSKWHVLQQPICQVSAYRNLTGLREKQMKSYKRLQRDRNDQTQFKSVNGETLGEYADQMGINVTSPLVPVCYGGNFMALKTQMRQQSMSNLWSRMEESLSRANNLAEGHFAERLWAAIMSYPLNATQIETLQQMANQKQPPCNAGPQFIGALTKD